MTRSTCTTTLWYPEGGRSDGRTPQLFAIRTMTAATGLASGIAPDATVLHRIRGGVLWRALCITVIFVYSCQVEALKKGKLCWKRTRIDRPTDGWTGGRTERRRWADGQAGRHTWLSEVLTYWHLLCIYKYRWIDRHDWLIGTQIYRLTD